MVLARVKKLNYDIIVCKAVDVHVLLAISIKCAKLARAGLMTTWMSHWRMLKELTVLY